MILKVVILCYHGRVPTVLIFHGFRFFFVSLDRGEPVHIHVEKGSAYAKYWLEPLSLARSHGFKPHELAQIRRIVQKHQKTFIRRWHEFFA